MALVDRNSGATLPEGYQAVPIADLEGPLRISLVVQKGGESGPFVRLRDFNEGTALLGCLNDRAGTVHGWLEIAVQHSENLGATNPAFQKALSNQLLDDRWRQRARQTAALEPSDVLWSGWEIEHRPPLVFDPAAAALSTVTDEESGSPWTLCTEDAALAAAGLPAYSTTLARYLSTSDRKRFVPVSPGSPASENTIPAGKIFSGVIPVNPSGGLLLIRTLAPLDFDEWADLLSGRPWKGIPRGKRPVNLGGVYTTLRDENQMRFGDGHFYLSGSGSSGRLVETAYLKLQSLAAALRAVEGILKAGQTPLLNLDAGSFGVNLPAVGPGLPFLWGHEVRVVQPGDALALGLETTETRHFIPGNFGETSIYRPAAAGTPIRGRGEVRVRKVLPGEPAILEASIVTQEKLQISGNDLLCLTLGLAGETVVLYGRIEKPSAGEVHFRTEPQKLAAPVVEALRQAEGVPFAKTPFQVLPVLSSPCDLYAMGVLAVRMLLANGTQTLPVALDEILAFARQIESEHELAQLVESNPRWQASLGPQRLTDEEAPAAHAIPPRLWWEIVEWIMRLFPGAVPHSFCKDLADAPALAIEKPFGEAILALEGLLRQLRGLILFDNDRHREMRSVIGKFLEGRS